MSDARVDAPGRQLLADWMSVDPKRRTRGYIARSVGVSQPAVTAWLGGSSRPVEELRPALELLTGIPRDAWRLQEERDREANALRLAAAAIAALDVEPFEAEDAVEGLEKTVLE